MPGGGPHVTGVVPRGRDGRAVFRLPVWVAGDETRRAGVRLRQDQLSGRWRDWLRRAGYVLRVVVIARAAATRARDGPRHRRRRTERRRRARSHCCVRWSRPLAVVRLVLSPSPRNGGQRLRPPRRPAVGGDDRALSAGPWRPQRVGTETASLRDEWTEARPDMDVKVMLLTGGGDAPSIPDAREKLGIDPSLRLALLDWRTLRREGSRHGARRVLGSGRLAPGRRGRHGRQPPAVGPCVPALSGLRRRPDLRPPLRCCRHRRHQLHPGFIRNSGTLRDAITWGVPVVCSDGSAPADVVRDYRLGTLFEAGDPAHSRSARRGRRQSILPTSRRARTERSSRVVAEQALHALGAIRLTARPRALDQERSVNQSMVWRRPSLTSVVASNPNNSLARQVSSLRRGWPFGLDVSQVIRPS